MRRDLADSIDSSFERIVTDVIRKLPEDARVKLDERLAADPSGEYLTNLLTQALVKTSAATAKAMAARLEIASPELLKHRARDRRGFERRLRKYWGEALDQLEGMIHGFWEYGADFYASGATRPELMDDPPSQQLSGCRLVPQE